VRQQITRQSGQYHIRRQLLKAAQALAATKPHNPDASVVMERISRELAYLYFQAEG
jgi:hypothetical protein